jgi:hypothetical protein
MLILREIDPIGGAELTPWGSPLKVRPRAKIPPKQSFDGAPLIEVQ